MGGTRTSGFTRGRIAALVLIGLATFGLAYLHVRNGESRMGLPHGAHSGELQLHPCGYAGSRAACGTLVVRENRHDSSSRLTAQPVTRGPARATAGVPIVRLQGGPGLSNMGF